MKRILSLTLMALLSSSLWACQNTPTQEQTPTEVSLDEETPLAFALLPMAWDGQQFWQLVNEPDVQGLLSQDPSTGKARNVAMAQPVPRHKSLAFGQGHLWALDNSNTVYKISLEGNVVNTLKLQMPFAGGAEQLVWQGDELWVLHQSYLAKESHERSRLYRINPESGDSLETRIIQSDRFDEFAHQNLAADDQAFYVVQANQYEPTQNRVYRIDKQNTEVQVMVLERVFSSVLTLFFHQEQLFGIELQEQNFKCGLRCQGALQPLPHPKSPL